LAVGQNSSTQGVVEIVSTGNTPTWDTHFGLPGVSGTVEAVAWSGATAYIGGSFTTAAGMPANTYPHVVMWTGTGFSALGGGLDGDVEAIAVMGTNVYVGGRFTHAGGINAMHLAVWNGTSWAAVGSGVSSTNVSFGEEVEALATDGTHLFVGGKFDRAGGIAAMSVSSYTPAGGFVALDAGITTCITCGGTTPGEVHALQYVNGTLWTAGVFQKAGPVQTSSLASWSGTAWAGYGKGLQNASGFSADVGAVTIDPATGAVYVVGNFTTAGTVGAPGVARLSGTTWSAAGSLTSSTGNPTRVRALAMIAGKLFAGGDFLHADGTAASYFASWDGTAWSQVGPGVDFPVYVISAAPGALVTVGGQFGKSGLIALAGLGNWNGTSWLPFGNGVLASGTYGAGTIFAVLPSGNGVIAGGQFYQVGTQPASSIARWTGTAWVPLGGGVTNNNSTPGAVYAMAAIGTDVYVAGSFNTAGGLPAFNIARWDGTTWHPLAGGLTGGRVNALVALGGKIYAGGDFSLADGRGASDLAVWNPATSHWSSISSNVTYSPGSINTLAANKTDLLIGGGFSTLATGSTTLVANGVVVYDTKNTGTTGFAGYRAVGGIDGKIIGMALSPAGDLYVGGSFTVVGPSGNVTTPAADIAVLHLASGQWSPLGSGISGGQVNALAFVGGKLYAGGAFSTAGGTGRPAVASYDPSIPAWAGLASGLQAQGSTTGGARVYAFAQSSVAGLFTGGTFGAAGPTPSDGLALWHGTIGQT